MLSFRKKNEAILRKVTDRQKDGWKDRHTLFSGPLSTRTCVQKNPQSEIGLLVSIRGHVHLIIAVLAL